MSEKPTLRAVTGGKREAEDGLDRAQLLSLDVLNDLIEKKKGQLAAYEARGADLYRAELAVLGDELDKLYRLKAEMV